MRHRPYDRCAVHDLRDISRQQLADVQSRQTRMRIGCDRRREPRRAPAGFMSKVSSWLGDPYRNRTIQFFARPKDPAVEEFPAAWLASSRSSVTPAKPQPPTCSQSRRDRPSHNRRDDPRARSMKGAESESTETDQLPLIEYRQFQLVPSGSLRSESRNVILVPSGSKKHRYRKATRSLRRIARQRLASRPSVRVTVARARTD